MSKAFASQGDLADKRETFDELAPGVFALTAEGDPNSGVVIGDDSVLVIDARATPVMAKELVARIRKVTDKPIRHVLLTHYHAVARVRRPGPDRDARCRRPLDLRRHRPGGRPPRPARQLRERHR